MFDWAMRRGEDPLAARFKSTGLRVFKLAEAKTATKNFSPDQLLGSGTFAKVYRGTMPDGSCFTFKRLKSPVKECSQEYELLERELTTVAGLEHENIVALKGYCLTKTDHILVYELAEGGTLDELMKASGGQVFLERRLRLALGLAEALEYLHRGVGKGAKGVIHRDVKPSNILLSARGEPKLADLGLLKLLDPLNEETVTRLAGSPGYLDPDFFNSGVVGFTSDVYAFGIVLLGLLTGRGPGVHEPADLDAYYRARATDASASGPRSHPADGARQLAAIAICKWVECLCSASQEDPKWLRAILDPALWPLLSLPGSSAAGGQAGKARLSGPSSRQGVASEVQKRGRAARERGLGDGSEAEEVEALRACLSLGLRCGEMQPHKRPKMAAVAAELRMILRSVPSALRSETFQDLAPSRINAMTQDLTTPLTHADSQGRRLQLFCGRNPWDGEPCIVQVACALQSEDRNADGPPSSNLDVTSLDRLLSEAKVASGFQCPSLLRVAGASVSDNTAFVLYRVPKDDEVSCLHLLEFMLFGSGADFVSFAGVKVQASEFPVGNGGWWRPWSA